MRGLVMKGLALSATAVLAGALALPAAAAVPPGISGGNDGTSAGTSALDTRTDFSILDRNHAISGTGLLTEWRYYAGTTSGAVAMKIYRLVSGNWMVVAMTPQHTVTATGTTGWLPLSPPLAVQAGDFVGFEVFGAGVIPYSFAGTEFAPDLTHTDLFTASGSNAGVGGTEVFTADSTSGSGDRVYSIEARGSQFFAYFGGNTGPSLNGKNLYAYAFDGFAAAYGYDVGMAFGSVSINYRQLNTTCVFTPGAYGYVTNEYVPYKVLSMRHWSSRCLAAGQTATIQVRDGAWDGSRGAIAVYVYNGTTDADAKDGTSAYRILNPSNGDWWTLSTGNVHVVDLTS